MAISNTTDGRVVEQTDLFVRALRASPLMQRFAAARGRFETDPQVQELLGSFQRQAYAFQRAEREGRAGPADVRAIREAQSRVQTHPVVRELVDAQQAVGVFLQETNAVITEALGVDFGQTAGPAGGAC